MPLFDFFIILALKTKNYYYEKEIQPITSKIRLLDIDYLCGLSPDGYRNGHWRSKWKK